MTTLKIIKVFLSFALICFLNPLAHSKGASQDEKNKNDSRVVIVEGKILNGNGNSDTVILFIQKEFIYNYIGSENYQQVCESNGHFKFVFHIDHTAKISLFLNDDTKILFGNIYIQPGDAICATI